MDIIISSLVSILATVIIGWFFFWKQKVKSEITHYSKNSYDIGKGLSEMFPGFQLQYNGNNLVGDVKVLKGYIVNSGNRDVAELDKKPIQLLLPDGCKVKASNVSFVSKDLEVNPAIGDSEIDFMVSDGVLKTNDLFEYTAIIETPKGIKSLKDGLKLGPRRENLDYNYMFDETKKDDDMLFKSFISRIIVAIALFVLLLLLVWFNFSMPISFDYKALDKNTNREAFVYTSHHGDIYLADEEHELSLFSKHRITKEELFDNYTFKPIIGDDDTRKDLNAYQNYITYLMLSVPCLIMIVYFIDNYLAGRKKRNITRLLQKNKDTNK